MPVVPPVTRATLPSSFLFMGSPYYGQHCLELDAQDSLSTGPHFDQELSAPLALAGRNAAIPSRAATATSRSASGLAPAFDMTFKPRMVAKSWRAAARSFSEARTSPLALASR